MVARSTCEMADNWTTDEALARLETMHARVEKLRNTLKDLQANTYSAVGRKEEDPAALAHTENGVSKNYT